VDARTGRLIGAEALLRWDHPARGAISPGEFIPLLERTGRIIPVGEWVLRRACAQVQQWQSQAAGSARPGEFRVSVNLSLKQFQRRELAEVVNEALRATGADPRLLELELELTESSIAQDPEEAANQLTRLREIGVSVAIDDFGTGYSSLSCLKQLPIDVVKIDRAFIDGITHNPGDAAILRAVVTMASSLKLRTIAEGVETADQLRFLSSEHCHLIQGFYFSAPLPPEQLADLLRREPPFTPASWYGEYRRTALLLLDDGDLRSSLRAALEADRVQVLEFVSPDEALSHLAGCPQVGVAIVGDSVQGEEPAAFLHRLSQLHPRVVRILLAGRTDMDLIQRAVNVGQIDQLFDYGCNPKYLGRQVGEALDRYERSREWHAADARNPADVLP